MKPAHGELYIGLMSGTSLDGIDGVLMDLGSPPLWRSLAHAHQPFDPALKRTLLALNTPGSNELHLAALAAQDLVKSCSQVVTKVCARAGVTPAQIRAIGAHGQTVRHRPELGYTLQLNAPAVLAELTGIDVVADFRSRDVAAGGQGAPLVPAFHQALFEHPTETVVVLNVGGMANLSILRAPHPPLGFDCGPGNALMDAWCEQHTGQAYDEDGAWGAQGQVNPVALDVALSDPFFALPPPKSTGRDLFNPSWLQQWLNHANLAHQSAQDVQATLCELTARSAAVAVKAFAPSARQLVVCGGGALNGALMQRLQTNLPGVLVQPSDAHGLPVMQVEAAAFAWLAQRHVHHLVGNVPQVTGAKGARVLGALYPA
ncbi:anhydro-N-acetylmuramic acid kinase [Aquabacterium sp.]|uniref:anhydro-N-acetylmuramic acid kinase n=1 Tax=Aquabacterium sp. TaxID=1872578 RepID=UPI0024882F51|nr:anhydro-N-acetylmuramic acid kinase [Aquabacterium sp.]MDI1259828.1 anhydro-N-acetylmuramic acid kinase [Aquabacterium sp.]